MDAVGIVTGIVAAAANREPRESETVALPENYTPIVLPGESISKYRGVEPVTVQEPSGAANAAESDFASETATVTEPVTPVEQVVASQPEAMPEEPLTSASYSGVSGLPSLTQRHATEVEETHAEEVEESAEVTPEPVQEVVRTRCPSASGIEQSAIRSCGGRRGAHRTGAGRSSPKRASSRGNRDIWRGSHGTRSSGSGAGRKRSQRT